MSTSARRPDETTPHKHNNPFSFVPTDFIRLIESPKEAAGDAVAALGHLKGIADGLHVDLAEGLTTGHDTDARARVFGRNYIPPPAAKSFLELMKDAFDDVTIIVLSIAGVLSIVLGTVVDDEPTGWIEGVSILVAVLVVLLVTAVNDYQKEKQFRALNAVIDDEKIKVIRNGEAAEVSKFELVVGDIVRVELGDILPADGLVFDQKDLRIDESAMTGESVLISKNQTERPFLLSGTKVMEGLGKMLVICVGPHSQSGIISSLIAGVKTTPVAKKDPPQGDAIYIEVHTPHDEEEESTTATHKEIRQSQEQEGPQEEPDELEMMVSPLQGKLNQLTVFIGKAGTGIAIMIFIFSCIRFSIQTFGGSDGNSWEKKYWTNYLDFIIISITVLVVAIPEGLPLAVTIALAYSVKKMLKDKNLVRHLDACETMGSATTICSDKTGTLTTNRMTVMVTWLGGREFEPQPQDVSAATQRRLVGAICLNSTAEILGPTVAGGLPEHTGNKTECALLQLCTDLHDDQDEPVDYRVIRKAHAVSRMITFSSLKKRMSVVVSTPTSTLIFTKGATEIVLDLCTEIEQVDGSREALTRGDRADIREHVIEKYASRGLRTLCLAYREVSLETATAQEIRDDWTEAQVESQLVCLAIVGIEDPVRPEVPGAIEQCRQAGIVVRMVTGDNVTTATSIARKCGILNEENAATALIMEGQDFRDRVLAPDGTLDQAVFDTLWPRLRVLARSSPSDKHTLVSGIIASNLASEGPQVVAVTGDGTNDAPALKKADVGFAMGISGTAVAKDASDIILMDDNFISIVNAVKWGRNVYDSIAKFLQFQLTVNVVAIVIAMIGAIFLDESPLTAIQLLWVNLIMDAFASLALATEEPTLALLRRKPYARTKPLLSRKMIKHIFGQSLVQVCVLVVLVFRGHELFHVQRGSDVKHGTPSVHYTLVFNTFVFMQLFNEINARKIHDEWNVLSGILANELFLVIMAFQVMMQVVIVQVGGQAFGTTGLSLSQWCACIALGVVSLPVGAVLRLVEWESSTWWTMSCPVMSSPRENHTHQRPAHHVPVAWTTGQSLWMRGLTRVRAQIRVVNAFKSGLNHVRATNARMPVTSSASWTPPPVEAPPDEDSSS